MTAGGDAAAIAALKGGEASPAANSNSATPANSNTASPAKKVKKGCRKSPPPDAPVSEAETALAALEAGLKSAQAEQ